MKILFCINSFFPKTKAGTEIYVKNLSKNLQKHGHEILIITPSVGTRPKAYDYEGLTVNQFEVPSEPTSRELNGLEPPHGQSNLLNIIKKYSPDIVHIHTLGRAFNGYTVEAVKRLNIPTVITQHLSNLFCIRGDLQLHSRSVCDGHIELHKCMVCYLRKKGVNRIFGTAFSVVNCFAQHMYWLRKFLPPSWRIAHHRKEELLRIGANASAIVAIAPWIEKVLKDNGLKNVCLIEQGLIEDFAHSIPIKDKLSKKNIVIGFAGRIYPNKGVHLLVSAAEKLREENIEFHIVGICTDLMPEYYLDISKQAKKLPNVIWEENLSSVELRQRMLSWDMLCLPSTGGEMAPLVILEAASCGVPTIGSDYPAIADMVRDEKNGLLFKCGDLVSLLTKLKKIVNKPELISHLGANLKYPRTFSDVTADTLSLYHAVLNENTADNRS